MMDGEQGDERGTNRLFGVLAGFALLSLIAGVGLMAWGIGKGNPLAGIVGVLLLLDAGVVFLVAWRYR